MILYDLVGLPCFNIFLKIKKEDRVFNLEGDSFIKIRQARTIFVFA